MGVFTQLLQCDIAGAVQLKQHRATFGRLAVVDLQPQVLGLGARVKRCRQVVAAVATDRSRTSNLVGVVPQIAVQIADQDEVRTAGTELFERGFKWLHLPLQHRARTLEVVVVQTTAIQGRYARRLQMHRHQPQ